MALIGRLRPLAPVLVLVLAQVLALVLELARVPDLGLAQVLALVQAVQVLVAVLQCPELSPIQKESALPEPTNRAVSATQMKR
jgi:hypothetical protein